MAYQIIWTDEAKDSFQYIIDYLQYKFTDREVTRFILAFEAKINLIKMSPDSYRRSKHSSNVHYTNILRKTILVYRIKQDAGFVELIHFWDARRNPDLFNV
jgi:plasmid stabilization system protein ParE